MDPEILKYRTCSNPGCTYKEIRGSRQGAFVAGKFVCDECYMELRPDDHSPPR
jgi:hypothetical protein